MATRRMPGMAQDKAMGKASATTTTTASSTGTAPPNATVAQLLADAQAHFANAQAAGLEQTLEFFHEHR